ncbi:hypothetical protein ONZ51_g11648 [Trametes cubensis]|uniref:Uncharacterized protein n=1 Tax=Trametes cubensis TaxID=1111947 RepID=A0AAD7TIW6_9APHY|nr:hypothetical protein ONZ51_g11648 [Trametes cubensis]
MVGKQHTRSSVYQKPRFYPQSLYATRSNCKAPRRTLQALMGMTDDTPSFKWFVETARRFAERFLIPTESKEGQPLSQWRKFEDKVARHAPCVLKYEDNWPAEFYFKIWRRLEYHKHKPSIIARQKKGKARAQTQYSTTASTFRTPSNSPSPSPTHSSVVPSPEPTVLPHAARLGAKAPEINLRQTVRARQQCLSRPTTVFRIKREDGLPHIPPGRPDACVRSLARNVAAAATQRPEVAHTPDVSSASRYQTAATTASSASAVSPKQNMTSSLRPIIAFLASLKPPLIHLTPILASIGAYDERTLLALACMPNRRIWMDRVLGQHAIGHVDWNYLQDGLDVLELTEG